jgi:hypothetical protein
VLKTVRRQTDTLSETWGFRNFTSESQLSDSISILSLDLNDKTFDFDEEISKLGPYRRVLRAQLRNQRHREQPTGNLIDDDLLDLSIDPLIPGRWTEELQRKFSLNSSEHPDVCLEVSNNSDLADEDDIEAAHPEGYAVSEGGITAEEHKLPSSITAEDSL